MYFVNFKHDRHGSDRLGFEFDTADDAERFVATLRRDPAQFGLAEWLRDASLWVEPEFVESDFLGLGYTSQTRADGSGRLVRFLGSPGEYVAGDFGPGCYFRTAEAAIEYFEDNERQSAAAERRCPQM